jgi:glycosyltransferase involved in cell wall biosynthesis
VGGIPEIVTDCRNGFLVAPGKSDQIADAVMKYLQMSSEGIEIMRLDNRRKVELEFNSEVENEKLYKIFKELIGRNPRWA